MKIMKRFGAFVVYDDEKIVRSIMKANAETEETLSESAAAYLADAVLGRLVKENEIVSTDLIRRGVYDALNEKGLIMTAKHYMEYDKKA